jgi:regulator of sigma E protease
MNVFLAIFGLAFLILVHEAGHFFTALATGMRPRRFYIGFPPPIARVKRRGIEYGIGAIPLGGYVKIPGMHRPAPSDVDAHFGRAMREAPALVRPIERVKRLLAAGELERAAEELPALEEGLAETSLSPEAQRSADRGLNDLGDALAPEAYWRQRAWKKVLVIFAGPGTNLLFAIALFAILFMVGNGQPTTTVGKVLPGRPAAQIGLQHGDRIVAINGRRVAKPEDIPDQIAGSHGRPVTVLVERKGDPFPISLGPVRPREIDGAYRLGFVLAGRGLGFWAGWWESLKLTGIITRETGKSLARIAHGKGRKDVSSPVRIVQESSTAASAGWGEFVLVLGFISLSLALLNLLPLLPLDGGHIAFSVIEGIRGRAVGREVYERVSAVGIALVLLLFIVGLSNDVGRLGGG